MRKNQVILISIGVLILIGLSVGFGFWCRQRITGTEKEVVARAFLTSKIIKKWNAFATGKVLTISNRKITIANEGEILTIPIAETAGIYLSNPEEKTKEGQFKIIPFTDIKIGDDVGIQIGINNGDVEGETLIITVSK